LPPGEGDEVLAPEVLAAVLVPPERRGATRPQRVEHTPLLRCQRRQGLGMGPRRREHLRQGRTPGRESLHGQRSGSGGGRFQDEDRGQVQLLERSLNLGQAFQFGPTEDLRAAGLRAHPRQEALQLVGGALEDQVVEAAQGTDGLIERTGGQVPLLPQVAHVRLEFLVADPVRDRW
jgi:hypothetical protein